VAVPVSWRPPSADDPVAELTVWVHFDEIVAGNTVARSVPRLEAALSAEAGVPVRVTVDRRRPLTTER
jgi:hypothetical protein